MWSRTFRALTSNVSVQIDDGPLRDTIDALTRVYTPADGPIDLRFRVEHEPYARLYCDEQLDYGAESTEDIPPAFELGLYNRVMAAYRGWLIHGAAVATDEGAIVLAGESGAGKTTMTLALMGRGARYITEECVGLDASGVTAGLARPINLVPRDAASVRGFATHPYDIRSSTGQIRRYTLALPVAERVHPGPCRIAALVRLSHVPGEPTTMRRMASADALSALWECSLRDGPPALAAATAVLERHPVHELRASSVASALEALGAFAPSIDVA